MPILEIEVVLRPEETLPPTLAAACADSAAAVFGASPGRTWVRLRTLPDGHYAEDHGGPPLDVHPVFVTVLHAHRPKGEALTAEVQRLTNAIAAASGRPADQVHVLYQPDAAGRMAFGGQLVP